MLIESIATWFLTMLKGSPMSRFNAVLLVSGGTIAALWFSNSIATVKENTDLHTQQIEQLSTSARTDNDKAEQHYLDVLQAISDLKTDASAIKTSLQDLEWFVRHEVQPHRVP